MRRPPAPTEILEMIFCNCKTGCSRGTCTCRKAGLNCSSVCGSCFQGNCTNYPSLPVVDDEGYEDDESGEIDELSGYESSDD